MRALLLRLLPLAVFPIGTLGLICLPVLPDPPNPYTGTAPLGTFQPAVSAAVAPATAGAAGTLTLSVAIPAGDLTYPAKPLLPAGIQILLPPQWGVAADAAITDGDLVGGVTGTFTASNDFFDNPICQTTADFATPLQDATTNTASAAYPAWLNVLAPGTHKARYYGLANVENTDEVPVNILVDEYADGREKIAAIFGDPYTLPDILLESMCAPWSFTLTLYGSAPSGSVYTNPSVSGAYTIRAILTSEWDEDNDGWGNQLDNCQQIDNAAQIDADFDFLGAGCDPNDSMAVVDLDADGIPNGYDNCPASSNASQVDADLDNLGDACDANSAEASRFVLDCTQDVFIGVSGSDAAGCVALAAPVVTPTAAPSSVGGVAFEPELRDLPAAATGIEADAAPIIVGTFALAAALAIVGAAFYLRRRRRA